ncbi:unnamed protein product [Linum trigynum]|uniref:Uncharacterized protein n=1 Tax=Linum trigynum TaxID=586398 RepID=A0AAV2CJC8_9ROSI
MAGQRGGEEAREMAVWRRRGSRKVAEPRRTGKHWSRVAASAREGRLGGMEGEGLRARSPSLEARRRRRQQKERRTAKTRGGCAQGLLSLASAISK